jgi:hypothetical protein
VSAGRRRRGLRGGGLRPGAARCFSVKRRPGVYDAIARAPRAQLAPPRHQRGPVERARVVGARRALPNLRPPRLLGRAFAAGCDAHARAGAGVRAHADRLEPAEHVHPSDHLW